MPLDDRERSFENALARHLRPSGSAGACSDAETLASYHEQSLEPGVMASLKAHISECARCQQILAQLQATDEIPLASDIAQPETAAATTGVRVMPARRPTLLRWVAPAGALAAGFLVWVAVHENKLDRFAKVPTRGDAVTQIAKAQPSSALPPPSLDATANSERVAADTFKPTDSVQPSFSKIAPGPQQRLQSRSKEKDLESARKPSAAAGVAGGFADGAARLVTPPVSEPVLEPTPPRSVAQTVTVEPAPAAAIATNNRLDQAESGKNESEAKAANEKRDAAYSRPASPMPAVTGAVPAPAPAAPPAPQQSSESVEVTAESSAITSLPVHGRQVADLTNLNQRAQLLLASGSAPVTVSAPDGRASWRIGPGGVILFSSDGGKTWLVQPSGTITDLLAGSAPSDKVCWIVGRSGTILRTSDRGKHWKKVTPPTQDDLRSVFAANDHQATVSPANGTYKTSDGGATWKPLPRE
jgi:hypothetical protein